MNVTVINGKDLIKYIIGIIFIILATLGTLKYLNRNKDNKILQQSIEKNTEKIFNISCKKYIELILPKIETTNIEKTEKSKISLASAILNMQLKNNEFKTDLPINEEELTIDDVDEIIETANTEVIEEKNIKTRYTNECSNVQIRNESDYELTEDMLTPNIELTNKKDIIIFHTHTCESYTPSEQFTYEMTGNYRTTDLNYTVSRVGDELANILTKRGYNIIHDKAYHDYPAYSGSYSRSLTTVENILKNSSAELVIDLHRDAVGNGSDYAPTVKINDEYAAQLMFVIGTNGGGLEHPNWQENLKIAIKIQQKANELYPGLFRPIIVRNSRYNQHLAKGACIIEVGATGNTLEQTLVSMKYLANVISETVK